MGANHKSTLSALAAVVLWASLAPLTALTPEIPTFLKTGLGLIIGATCAIPVWTREAGLARLRIRDVLLGIYGLLGYHTFLFLAFDTSPKVSANLINYLWPLFIVVLAPVFNRQLVLGPRLSLAALLGFVGAGLAILSAGSAEITFYPGYFFALAAALVWSTFSLASARSATFSARSLGLAALFSGAISICAHLLFEKSTTLDVPQILLLVAMGLGPLGAAFYFWDHALRQGNPQQVGLLSFLTPPLSTSILLVVTGQQLSILLVASALLIAGGSLLGRTAKV
ncbi:MAG: hypothetical protein RLZZ122_224 [Actinomycetota bacterium]